MALHIHTFNAASDSQRASSYVSRDVHELLQQKKNSSPAFSAELLSVSELANHCMSEINNYRCGAPSGDQYSLELFHRALMQRDAYAWEVAQRCFNKTVLHWMHVHPLREVARRYDSDENYIAQAFARFWQATVGNQKIEFQTLGAVLRYLRACLHGAIIDTLRTYSRPQQVSLPDPGEPGEPVMEERANDGELWEVIQNLLPEGRQRRAAYLLFYCQLKPGEIVHFRPQEFSDVREIYNLRRKIVERLLRNSDYIRRRLDDE